MKKFIITLILCSTFLSILSGCGSYVGAENENIFTDRQESNDTSIIPTMIEQESSVTPIIPTITEVVYQEVLPYFDNRIVVKQTGKYGIIDNLGNVVMPITQTNRIEPKTMDTVGFIEDTKYGLLSLKGDVLAPAIYDAVLARSTDLVQLIINNEPVYVEKDALPFGGYGVLYMDKGYEIYFGAVNKFYSEKHKLDIEIIGCIHKVIVGQSFFVIDYSTKDKYNLKKIITFDGEVFDVDEFEPYGYKETDANGFGSIVESFEGSIYRTSKNDEYLVTQKHLIDMFGNIIVDLTDENSRFVFDENNDFYISDEIIISEGGIDNYAHYVFNLINHKKEKIETLDSKIKVSDVMDGGCYEISALSSKSNYTCYYGLMSDDYKIIAEPIYDSVEKVVNGYCPVELNGYFGYVDKNGNLTTPPMISGDDLNRRNSGYFSYNWSVNDGSLIDPRNGEPLPYQKAELCNDHHSPSDLYNYRIKGIFEAILNDEITGETYKSFVTWDGPIVEHKFPNTEISVSEDGKVAVYSQGAKYTIVELP